MPSLTRAVFCCWLTRVALQPSADNVPLQLVGAQGRRTDSHRARANAFAATVPTIVPERRQNSAPDQRQPTRSICEVEKDLRGKTEMAEMLIGV